MGTNICEKNGNKNIAGGAPAGDNLEKALASFGALAAISIVRKNFPGFNKVTGTAL
ncbi:MULTISPECIES: hypothetical protein [unclassified Butyrivibrio]|uniref:hypothetical protein n=1 Tax=unclassified Butyrivibrio TaxID=2639466 RepID=UPI0003B718C1|nr:MULTISPECIES: hypothetical protein [unclassified Butyrivibrio]MDC7292352.1 hypothetical protein [Butyrivibrio sp. DSM 10294]